MPVDVIRAQHAFPLEGCTDPIIHWCRNNPDHLCRLGALSESKKRFGAPTLSRRREAFDFSDCHFIQKEMIRESGEFPSLWAHDFGCCVRHDTRTMKPRLLFRPHKVFNGLADSPYA